MPALSHHFGLSPAQIWDLTSDEMKTYLNAIEDMRKSNG